MGLCEALRDLTPEQIADLLVKAQPRPAGAAVNARLQAAEDEARPLSDEELSVVRGIAGLSFDARRILATIDARDAEVESLRETIRGLGKDRESSAPPKA